MNIFYSIILACYALLTFSQSPSWAQELSPPDSPPPPAPIPDNFTGTLAEDDPDNKDLDKELFGGPQDEEPQLGEDTEDEPGTHMIRFDFTSSVQFIEQKEKEDLLQTYGEPYMEIEYKTTFETPVFLSERTIRTEIEAEYDIDVGGSLARGEFFDCRLDIEMRQVPVTITSKLHSYQGKGGEGEETPEEGEGEEVGAKALALKLSFEKEPQEVWWALCTDVTGATLNTQGDREKYNFEVMGLIEPKISALLFEGFVPDEGLKLDLTAESTVIQDNEIANDVVLSGNGTISVEPL